MGDELRMDVVDPLQGNRADRNVSDAMVRLLEDSLVSLGKEVPQRHMRWAYGQCPRFR